jgi:tetratricopeptide (TPR) repeat protein
MSNPKTEAEISELIARSRDEAERGNYSEAYRLIRELPLGTCNLSGATLLRASLAMRLEQYEDALVFYEEIASAVDVCKSIHLNRIECMLRLGRAPEVEAALEAEDSPLRGHYGRHLMLARIAARKDDAAGAIAHLRASYRLNPQALAYAASFPELGSHLRKMIVDAWRVYRVDNLSQCLN